MVRIAYFVMVHHKPRQFEWLMRAIADPRDRILVHVDLKSRLGLKSDRRGVGAAVERIVAATPGARLLRSQLTNWGGWSLSRMLLDAIREALRDPDWTHFVNLSGQCYPLQPIAAIRDGLAAAGDQVHVELLPIDGLPADDWHRNAHRMLELPVRAIKLPGRQPPPTGFALDHKGSQWVMLPRAFCEWLVTAPLTAAVSRYLSRRLLSDELVMQALVANGPWADRVAADYRRHIVWPGPKLLSADDVPALMATDAWFGRKFDVETVPEPVVALVAAHGFAVPE